MDYENKIYELSLWSDSPNDGEIKICTIASHAMTSPAKAFNIILNRKTNGEKTLTFSVLARYISDETGEYEVNPYLSLLTNERKVKLKKFEKGQILWYDMIIKNVAEDSSNYTYTYTAKDQHVQELAKSGFELEFDKERQNNIDTKDKLAELILDGTDWTVGQSDALLEYTKEPIFRGQLNPSIILESMLPSDWSNVELEEDNYVYVPYSEAKKTEGPYQILYYANDASEKAVPYLDEENVLLRKFYKNYTVTQLPTNMVLQTGIQGEKLIQSQKTIYDNALEQYVNVYNDGNIYGFTRTEYYTPEFVENLITNGAGDFTSTSGWHNTDTGERNLFYSPEPKNWSLDSDIQSFIEITSKLSNGQIMNSGIFDNRSKLPGFTKGQKYRFKCELDSGILRQIIVAEYDTDSGYYGIKPNGLILFQFAPVTQNDSIELTCLETITKEQLKDKKFGIFLRLSNDARIKSCEFYRLVQAKDSEGNLVEITPGSVVGTNAQNLIKTHYYYYNKNQEYTKFEDIVFDYEGYEKSGNYLPTMNEGCEKRRSITGKESNRFNLLQEICEQFECWLSIDVEHDATGHITNKSVSFHEYVGKDNYAGFKYGINLKSIKRDIDSNQIVTKMITKDNANELAKNGFCSIARAPSNPSGTNVIYNFDYYVNQGLLSAEEVSEALYATSQNFVVNDPGADSEDIEFIDGIGLYPKLGYITDITKALIEEQIGLSKNLVSLKASTEVEQAKLDAAETELVTERESLYKLTKYTYEDFLNNIASSDWANSEETQSYKIKIYHLTKIVEEAKVQLATLNASYETFQVQYNTNDEKLKYYNGQRKKIEQQFYQTYSRFIQEGSWISEEYVDDELYYLDALATGYTSSRPKISYTINVFDLAGVEDYENYEFQIGDKTFVEDPEFFGWKKAGNGSMLRVPYREEVVVNELTEGIDDITKNALKVQNYKTQFDDLFQRIAATTESLQYNTGRYERSAKAVETDGSISHKALQQAVTENGLAINNAGAQTVTIDEQGVITTDKALLNKKVRIIGGGIYVTKDGGETWETGITGDGVNANVITTGQLNAGEVNIMTGNVASHRWDDKGISAYQTIYDFETGNIIGVENRNFVRFDEFGLYNICGHAQFNARTEETVIKDNKEVVVSGTEKIRYFSIFSLTQGGLTIGKDGYGLKATEEGITIGQNMKINETEINLSDTMSITKNKINIGNGFIATPESLTVAGWTVEENMLAGKEKLFLSPSGINKTDISGQNKNVDYTIYSNENFGITIDGKLHAQDAWIGGHITAETLIATKSGKIGGWWLNGETLSGELKETISDTEVKYYIPYLRSGSNEQGADYRFLGLNIQTRVNNKVTGTEVPFYVTHGGHLYANDVEINGKVTADTLIAQTNGNIAGWKLNSNSLYRGSIGKTNSMFLSPSGVSYTGSIGGSDSTKTNKWVITTGNSFGVDVNGNLYASNATINGKITADEGIIGGLKINSNFLGSTFTNNYDQLCLYPNGTSYSSDGVSYQFFLVVYQKNSQTPTGGITASGWKIIN